MIEKLKKSYYFLNKINYFFFLLLLIPLVFLRTEPDSTLLSDVFFKSVFKDTGFIELGSSLEYNRVSLSLTLGSSLEYLFFKSVFKDTGFIDLGSLLEYKPVSIPVKAGFPKIII
jgi:hypothetical protein